MSLYFRGQYSDLIEHTLIIGESFRGDRQYDMIRYDFKPKSIDTEKDGILENGIVILTYYININTIYDF